MTKFVRIAIICVLLGGAYFIFQYLQKPDGIEGVQSQLVEAVAPMSKEFARAEGPRPFIFPADHGPHPEYQTEWWYYTGNLDTPSGRHFAYQLTFFRRALIPAQESTERASKWATTQAYMAHFALTDVTGRSHQNFERLNRGAAGLAGAKANPFSVWLEDWAIEETQPGVYRLRAAQEGMSLDLELRDQKGPVLQGDQGYSRKGPQPGNASYYYSLPRLDTTGEVRVEQEVFQVAGQSWMDHEFSTSALSRDQVGWDWFSIQLDDGSELMVFQIRRTGANGQLEIDPFSSGTIIAPDGSTRMISREDFRLEVLDHWKSPRSQAEYPAGWRLEIPSANLTLEINPYLADQELNVSYSYWEGAVQVQGERQGQALRGHGFAELTGYAGSMGGEF